MMVPVFACPVLETSTRAFVSGMLPSLASSERLVAYLDYSKLNCVHFNYYGEFSRLNDDIDHNITTSSTSPTAPTTTTTTPSLPATSTLTSSPISTFGLCSF